MADSTTYLTAAEARDYLRFATTNAFRLWVRRHGVPKLKRGRSLLFLRRDLDDVVNGRFDVVEHVRARFGVARGGRR